MKFLFLLISLLHFPADVFAQSEKPDPFYQIVEEMKATDTFIVYGDLCSGCTPGTRERIDLVFKKKGVVWIKSCEYEYPFKYVIRMRKVPYFNDPFLFYQENKQAIDATFNEESNHLAEDTFHTADGRILRSIGFDLGKAQRIYIHYPNQILQKLFCCGSYESYKKNAPLLFSFFNLFPKGIGPRYIPLDPEPNIYSITR